MRRCPRPSPQDALVATTLNQVVQHTVVPNDKGNRCDLRVHASMWRSWNCSQCTLESYSFLTCGKPKAPHGIIHK